MAPASTLLVNDATRPEIALPSADLSFRVLRLSGAERVSGLFDFEVDIEPLAPQSFDPTRLQVDELMGRDVELRMVSGGNTGGTPLRVWRGILQQLTIVPVEEASLPHVYRVRIVPWLALWDLATSCRIFEDVLVTDVVQQMLADWHSSARCDQRLTGVYERRRYCCQFQETDLNFFSRLLEEEGIFYYFDHVSSGDRLVLVDNLAMAGSSSPLVMDVGSDITHWQANYRLHSGSHAVRDYDEYSAEIREARETTIRSSSGQSNWEQQVYPGRVASNSQAARRARIGMEREESRRSTFRGTSRELRIGAGDKVSLRAAENRTVADQYFVTSVHHVYDGQYGYRNTLSAQRIEENGSYRPPRTAAKPVILGPQTAVVTDEAPGEDLPGTVRVRFPWDKHQGNSCRIRVAEMLAGDGWGTWFPPHVDHEVMVEFLNGDPDRPLVTGRLYHGRHQPAESDVQVTAIRTERGQELRFMDEAGNEEVALRGKRHVEIVAGTGTLTVKDAVGNEIVMSPSGGIVVRSPLPIKVEGVTFEISAAMVTINAGMTRVSGVLQCDTLLTNAVVSASYTPGAGNLW